MFIDSNSITPLHKKYIKTIKQYIFFLERLFNSLMSDFTSYLNTTKYFCFDITPGVRDNSVLCKLWSRKFSRYYVFVIGPYMLAFIYILIIKLFYRWKYWNVFLFVKTHCVIINYIIPLHILIYEIIYIYLSYTLLINLFGVLRLSIQIPKTSNYGQWIVNCWSVKWGMQWHFYASSVRSNCK